MSSKQFLKLLKQSRPLFLLKRNVLHRPLHTQTSLRKNIPLLVTKDQPPHVSIDTPKPLKKTFKKLLIANRGEIACRIIKTAKKMGIKTVAVYSDLDANALHVQLADEAVHLGPASSSESYLSIPRVLHAIQKTGADAVHPGYGFLSENPLFVKALEENKIIFVGPKASAIAAMGDKIQSKLLARASGVNCIPGFDGEVKNSQQAVEIANEIGYPVMVKASAGGGGKGMRIAWNDKELIEGFKLAKQESKSSFDDDRMLIEKYIDNPRHIEIQVLGDNFGNVVYLPERECSIQRRNQKVIEESPSVHVDPETRQKMGEQAVALAKHVGYNSAGTVEFLVDGSRNFYFLEMNTRLQVEHPITEYVTGLDLVEQMLYSASNYPLAIQQDQIGINGWAFESRVYAEDPEKYLPSVGRLLTYQEPSIIDNHIRCDSGFIEGSEMYVEYDPLICKLATFGKTRKEALNYMINALDEYVIKGVTHNIPLLRAVFSHPRFQNGKRITTHFLAEEYPNGFKTEQLKGEALEQLAAITSALWIRVQSNYNKRNGQEFENMWVRITDEQNQHVAESCIKIKQNGASQFEAAIAGDVTKHFSTQWPLNGLLARSNINDKQITIQYLDSLDMGFRIQYHGNKYKVQLLNDLQHQLSKYIKQTSTQEQSKIISSPMPGKIIDISVKEGDEVVEGSELITVEAMKMQNILRTPRSGIIKKINVHPGNNVKSGQVLIEFMDE